MASKKSKQNNTYEYFTLDRKNVDAVLSKIDDYFKKNGRTVVGE
jgi:hypothetical protein